MGKEKEQRTGHDGAAAVREDIFIFAADHADGNFTAFIQCVGHHRAGQICERRIGGRRGIDGIADQSDGQFVFGAFGWLVYCGGALDRCEKRRGIGSRGAYGDLSEPDRRSHRGRVRGMLFEVFAVDDERPGGQRSAPFDVVSADLFCGNAFQSFV